MSWVLPRVLAVLAAGTAGAGAGFVAGSFSRAGQWGAALGAMGAVAIIVGLDAWRGRRLLKWLRGAMDTSAPRDAGFWGEMGYRIEKALRLRERQALDERQRLAQFLSAMEASPNGVMLVDAGEQIDWMNTVAAQHFGLSPERDRLQRVTNLVRAPAFKAHLDQGRFNETVNFLSPDGRTMLAVIVRPYGEGLKLVISQDITERERNESMRRDFVANVSHEIRTPLTVLAGFVETMATLPLNDGERRRVLGLMTQQTDRMQGLVADLLVLARLEGSPRPAADRWIALAPLLQRALADAQALSAGRHRFEAAVDDAPELAGADAELYSAVGNLLSNAVRYTPDGGRIALRWSTRADGGGAIEVADSGIGIAREHLPRLTERFYRVDGSRSRETGGTGLGLSIVKHVMQRHGGSIEVESEPGQGSCFRMLLPAARLRAPGQAMASVLPPLSAEGAATGP